MGMRKSEESYKVKVEDSTLLPNLEKQENTINCSKFERSEACSLNMSNAIQTENIKEVDLNVPSDINVTVVGTGNKHVILQYENRKFCIELLSYHGVYPKPENSLWCVLCKVKEDDVHLISEKHLSRLSELKFNGVDLIRYLSTSHAHCALCHLMLAVTELEEHLNSETHLKNCSSAKILSGDEVVRDDCTMSKLKDFLSTHLSESNDSELAQTDNTANDDKDLASDQTEYNADDLKVSDSVISVRSQTTELNPSADIIPQPEADIKSDGEAQKIVPNEMKPCSGNGHVSPVCNFELPSLNQKSDYDKSLPYTDADCQSHIGSGSPLTATTLNVASVTNKSKADNIIIENEFIRSHAAPDFPYSCILCDVKMSYFDHVWNHLKGKKHTQKLKNLNSKSVETKQNAGDCTGMSLPLSHSSRNITLDNVSVGSVQNSLAVKNTPVAEHPSEISCTMCHVNVPNAIWEQHTQGAEHNLKLREHMTLKYNVQGCDKTLTDDSSALETEDNVQTLSLEPKSVRSTIEAPVNFKIKQNSALIEVKPCSQANKISVIENENQLQKIAINKNFDSKIIPTQKATPNTQIKSDFISFVPKSVTCPYLCSLCNAKMPSLYHVKEHLNGARHMLNFKTLRDRVASTAKVNTKGSTSIGTLVTQPDQSQKVTMTTPSNPSCSTDTSKKLKKSDPTICAICNVEVPIAIWKQHVKGKTHRSKLNQAEQINSPASSGLNLCDLADSLGDLEQSLTSLMNLEHFIARLRNTNVEGQSRGKAQSSAGHVQSQSVLPTQASSRTNKIVKPKNPGQTVCTICRVTVPMSNMTEHVQGKPHLQNLRMMNT